MVKEGNRRQFFAAAAAVLAAVIVLLIITRGGSGFLLGTDKATSCVDSLMAAAHQGDLEQAAQYLYGKVTIQNPEDTTPLDSLRRDYLESITCSLGKCYTQDDALMLDLRVTHLDLASCRAQYESALQQTLDAREDTIDDSPEVFEAIAQEAIANVSPDSISTVTENLTLRLVNVDGRWLCVPTTELIDLLCGKY